MTDDVFKQILQRLKEHRRDGFEVPAVRISTEQYKELMTQREFIEPEYDDVDITLEYDDAIGMAAGTEIIVDENISDVVAEDVVMNND
jgi:hypothetical protein